MAKACFFILLNMDDANSFYIYCSPVIHQAFTAQSGMPQIYIIPSDSGYDRDLFRLLECDIQ